MKSARNKPGEAVQKSPKTFSFWTRYDVISGKAPSQLLQLVMPRPMLLVLSNKLAGRQAGRSDLSVI